MQLAMPNLLDNLVADETVLYRPAPRAFTLTAVKAFVLSYSVSGQIIINVKLNGVSILSTRITIEENEYSSLTAVAQPVIGTSSIPADGVLTVDVNSAGYGARGLVVTLIGE